MPTIEYTVYRDLPCDCTTLSATPFPCCPECGGNGIVEHEIPVTIEYEYTPASRGMRERSGLQLEPDEPASVEIIDSSVPLTPKEKKCAEEECMIAYGEHLAELRAEAAERRADERRERLSGCWFND